MTIARTIHAFAGEPDPAAIVPVGWATAAAFVLLQLVAVVCG